MKFIDTTCPHCGGKLTVGSNSKHAQCDFCGATLLIDDEINHIQYDNAEDAGYNFEKGRQKAQLKAQQNHRSRQTQSSQNKRKTWLWVLGWLLIFPIPLTILTFRNSKLNKGSKIGIIVISWVLYLVIGLIGGHSSDTNSTKAEPITDTSEIQNTTTQKNTTADYIESLVENYNSKATEKLSFVEQFDVQNKESSHYRTEFRLTAFSNSIGKTYKLGKYQLDIIVLQNTFGNFDIRVYSDGIPLEQCSNLVKNFSPLLDVNMDKETVNDAVDYINENKEANGYYYGDLGLLLLGNDEKGYDLMISTY